jgi:hypothetical protein
MVIARKLWMRRNQVVFGGDFMPPNQLLRDTELALEEFKVANSTSTLRMTNSSHIEEERWVPPPKNIIKINWDASLDAAKKIIKIEIIARDEKGKFLTAISKQESIEVELVVTETFAALTAITMCLEQNFQDVIFEGDALQVVKEVNSDKHCNNYYGHLVEDVKHGLKRLKSAKFSHVRHSANVAAHELAMLARTHVTDVIRWNILPPNISGIVQREGLYFTS